MRKLLECRFESKLLSGATFDWKDTSYKRYRAHIAVHAWDELTRQLNKVWFWGSKGMDWIGSSGAEKDWIGSNMLARFSMAFARMDLERVGVSEIEWNRVG